MLKAVAQVFDPGQAAVLLAQTDSRAGDVWGNFEIAKKFILEAKNFDAGAKNTKTIKTAKVVAFPELFLIGNPLGDLLSRHKYLIQQNFEALEKLAAAAPDVIVVIGFVNSENKSKIAVLHKGKILKNSHVFEASGLHFGVLSGDEDWQILKDKKLDFVINCACEITREGMQKTVEKRLENTAKALGLPLYYVNQTGATDSFSFLGASSLHLSDGQLAARAKSFKQELFDPSSGVVNPVPEGLEYVYEIIVHSIRAYFRKCNFKRAVLGLSGGLDSAVCAALLADALGAGNVVGVFMPTKITASENQKDAKELAELLGINFLERSINDIVNVADNALKELFLEIEGEKYSNSTTFDNIQARARAVILWGMANEFKDTITIATSDKSELYMGYATVNGDMSGGFAPICDVLKTKLFELADWINKNKGGKGGKIPQSIIKKPPCAELAIDSKTNKPLLAEDALMPYEFLDEAILRLEEGGEDLESMFLSKFTYESKNSVTKKQKREWLEKFFKRVEGAPFKWSLLPPGPVFSPHSISKSEYFCPITSKIL